jgi:hypothetical protein
VRTHDYWRLPSHQAMPWSEDPTSSGFIIRLEDGMYLVNGYGGMKYRPEDLDFEIGVTHAHP